jgi:hypothetical protein
MLYSASVCRREVRLSLQTPLVLIRWILVVIAVLAWLIVVPILELVALGYRVLAHSTIVRRLRGGDRLLPEARQPASSRTSRLSP